MSLDGLAGKDNIETYAAALGCQELIRLDSEPTAAHLEYLDLVHRTENGNLLPRAVAEFQGRPLLYLVDPSDQGRSSGPTVGQIQDLQTLLANRSEHACLGVVRPGSLEIYPINLDRTALAKAGFQTITIAQPGAEVFFQSLATGRFEIPGRPKQADYVFDTIHSLLSEASMELAGSKNQEDTHLSGLDVLSTTGRALFFRFLIDRKIVLPSELSELCPRADDLRDVFSDAEKAAATSAWLDDTFNGDLLPLVPKLTQELNRDERIKLYTRFYRGAGQRTQQRLFSHLQAILRGWKHIGNSAFQLSFDIDWDDFNFAHIPIGVLSQVYESFSRQWDERHAEETSVYYTPKHIARCLIEEAFAGLKQPAEAMVLDPACGAGMFLVLAFRHIVREFWLKSGTRPDTRAIQRILYKQLRGFEVSESALRLSALALYISAIELNGAPRPPRSLKFPRPLRGEVLFNFGSYDKDTKRGFVLGSLGADVPASFDGQFDVIATNPPWTRLRPSRQESKTKAKDNSGSLTKQLNEEFTQITRQALRERGLESIARRYTNPDNNPDLPFLWRATRWAKRGGIIAMALPGRVILRQSPQGRAAREAIFKGLSVTGILNGSDLEKTPVWPNMDLPFILLFARNSVPTEEHGFHFATPIRENRLSSRGQFRLDYQAAQVVPVTAAIVKPWLLKAIAVGTVLDADIIDQLASKGWHTLGEVWNELRLSCGDGYHLLPAYGQKPAKHLFELLDFERPSSGFSIAFRDLQTWLSKYRRKTAHAPRTKDLFSAPLVIIPQTPGELRERPKAYLSLSRPLAFAQGNYGFSGFGHSKGNLLVSLLYLITHSLLYRHFCLIRSSRIGASYRTFIKEDLEAFPFPTPSAMSVDQRRGAIEMAKKLQFVGEECLDEIDEFIFRLYGLDEHDAVVIRDTVAFAAPYRSVREPAESEPTSEEVGIFCNYLEEMLQPLFSSTGQRIAVKQQSLNSAWINPWRFLSVTVEEDDRLPDLRNALDRVMEEANKTGASRIVLRLPGSGLVIGLLNQRRFWTRSRARLCSLHVQEHHLDAFPIPIQ